MVKRSKRRSVPRILSGKRSKRSRNKRRYRSGNVPERFAKYYTQRRRSRPEKVPPEVVIRQFLDTFPTLKNDSSPLANYIKEDFLDDNNNIQDSEIWSQSVRELLAIKTEKDWFTTEWTYPHVISEMMRNFVNDPEDLEIFITKGYFRTKHYVIHDEMARDVMSVAGL